MQKDKLHPNQAFDLANEKYSDVNKFFKQKVGHDLNFKHQKIELKDEDLKNFNPKEFAGKIIEILILFTNIYVHAGVEYIKNNIANTEIFNLIQYFQKAIINQKVSIHATNHSLNQFKELFLEVYHFQEAPLLEIQNGISRGDQFVLITNPDTKKYEIHLSSDFISSAQTNPIVGLATLIQMMSFGKDVHLDNVDLDNESSYYRADAYVALFLTEVTKKFDDLYLTSEQESLIDKYNNHNSKYNLNAN